MLVKCNKNASHVRVKKNKGLCAGRLNHETSDAAPKSRFCSSGRNVFTGSRGLEAEISCSSKAQWTC